MFKLISHRGIVDDFIKENSYVAIKKALDSNKYVGVEFDVRETLDEEFIIYHDAFFNSKLVKNLKYQELPKYVPKLKDILEIKSNKIFLIEIKNIDSYDKLMKVLNKYSNKNIYVMSFSWNIIKKLDKLERSYKIGILNYVFNTNEYIKKLDFVGILNSLINEDILKILRNLEIFSYGLFNKMIYKNVYYIVDDK